jgi:hypothetical protein
VQERELVEGVGELGCGMLCRAFEPLDALSGAFGEAELAVELYYAEAVHGARVEGGGGLAEELEGLGGLTPAAPAVLAACARTVRCVRMAVLCSEDEEGVGAVKVLLALVGADAVCVAVCEKVLGGGVAAVGETLEEGECLRDEVVALLDGLFNVHDVAGGGLGYGVGL